MNEQLLMRSLPLILAALTDAAECRRERIAQQCTDCNLLGDSQLCEDHQADTDKASAYDRLREELVKRVPESPRHAARRTGRRP